MPDADATSARWRDVAPARGHYESFYLRALDPARPRGLWIRYTVEVRPGGRATGQVWVTGSDRDASGPRPLRVSGGEPDSGADAWIGMGNSVFGPTMVEGGVLTAPCA